MNSTIFLDSDGVINEDNEYVYKREDFKFLPNVTEALLKLQSHYLLFVITNQSGIGRGYHSENDFIKLNEFMIQELKNQGVIIQETYYCPHATNHDCECRKPKTKLLEQAAKEFSISLKNSWVVGDKMSDIEMGKNAGCKTALIKSRFVEFIQTQKFDSLYEAAEYILSYNALLRCRELLKAVNLKNRKL